VDTELDIFTELFNEFLEVFSVFSDFSEHFQGLFNNIFFNDLQNIVVLQEFSADV